MTCDFELGKFTYLDQIEPVIPSPRKRSGVIGMQPPILDLDCDGIEETEPLFEVTRQPDLISESVKRKLNGLSNGLDSPSKKVAVSEFVYFDDNTDYGTNQINEELFKVEVVSKQPSDAMIYEQPTTTTTKTTKTTTIPSQSPTLTPTKVNSEKQTTTTTTTPNTGHPCQWYMCETVTNFSTAELLFDHILSEHVEPCEGQEVFMCQWKRCKVYNTPSSSYNGYKGHVLAHTKAKMYRCLITDCPSSFRTREGLAHHMEMQNNHFIIPSENKKLRSKHKTKCKIKSKVPEPSSSLHRTRQGLDTFAPMRRSQRHHYTPSFKRFFTEPDSDEEDTQKSRDFLHTPVLRGIQRRAETIASCDLLHCMRDRSSGYEDKPEDTCSVNNDFEINEKNLIYLQERDKTEFQVIGQRMLEDKHTVECLCGFSKTLLDWMATETLPSLIRSSLILSTGEMECIHTVIRMRPNKRK